MIVNSLFNISNNYSIKHHNQIGINSGVICDSFIKSSNISFSSLNKSKNRQETVDSFKKDMRSQMYSPNFSLSDVSRILAKYTKNVNVKSMKQAPKELLFSSTLQGLYCTDLAFDSSKKEFVIPKKNRNFYLQTETFNQQFGNLFVFMNAVHEFTHILQSEDENSPQLSLYNDFISKNNEDLNYALEQIPVVSKTVNTIEEAIARPFINFLNLNQNLAYTRMQNGRLDMYGWICGKNKILNPDDFIKEKIQSCIEKAEEDNSISLDKNLILDATIIHFEKEIEAYKNENQAHKECLKIQSPLALTRIALYENSIEVLKQMKKE